MSLIRATKLNEVFAAFDAAPLTRDEIAGDFYVSDVNDTRGIDRIQQLSGNLARAHRKNHYKAFVMGHAGVGISTELTRLESNVSGNFRVLRLSANTDFDPVNFRPFDFVLRVALGLAELAARSVADGGAGSRISPQLIKKILDWFAIEKTTVKTDYDVIIDGTTSLGPGADSWWAKLLGLSARISAEAKTSSGRANELIEYREKNVVQLLNLTNDVLDECNDLLRAVSGCEWLIIGDDFDKPGIPPGTLKDFFITYGNLIRDLRVHLILDLPVSLGHSSISNTLPRNFGNPFNFPDTPVYSRDHTSHSTGRNAIRRIIETRADTALFADGQIERLIVASGGNIRDLFGLIFEAATRAEIRPTGPLIITADDVNPAISLYRKRYRDRLGSSPFDIEQATFDQKLSKLISIYLGEPHACVPDATLYSLLHARAVQEFNGEYWYGVHPLTVDFLNQFQDNTALEKAKDTSTSCLNGGTV